MLERWICSQKTRSIIAAGASSFFISFAVAQEKLPHLENYSSLETVEAIRFDPYIQQKLKNLLGDEYPLFSANFAELAAPAQLRDQGLYVEGWQASGPSIRQTSAFVIYPDGRIYAAYLAPRTTMIKYLTNDDQRKSKLHPALVPWYRQFGQYLSVLSKDLLPVSIDLQPRSAAENTSPLSKSGRKPRSWSDAEAKATCTVAASIGNESLIADWDQ